jgi:hypothetical protein
MKGSMSWVSKTDITRYMRCPYGFWLTDSSQLNRAELLSPFEARLAGEGVAFRARHRGDGSTLAAAAGRRT